MTTLPTVVSDSDSLPDKPSGGLYDVQEGRAAHEVQAAMAVAKRFPRNQNGAYGKIIEACKRVNLAKTATYAYPRGGQTVTGPSIRLAETLAQAWGNLDFGLAELERGPGTSKMMSYCWDLETNVRQVRIFDVQHARRLKGGKVTHLTDPRDVYEMVANQGARRLRACILGVIPGDIVDAAVEQCEKTLSGAEGDVPLGDRVRKMAVAFSEHGVTEKMIEQRIGHKVGTIAEAELVKLRQVYQSIADNFQPAGAYFDDAAEKKANGSEQAQTVGDKLKNSAKDKPGDGGLIDDITEDLKENHPD